MAICSDCGVQVQDDKKVCQACLQKKITATWKRQMRFYVSASVLGAVLLVFAIYQARSLPHAEGMSGMPLYILEEAALGGLGLLGGLFGLALAVFFNIWHKKKAT